MAKKNKNREPLPEGMSRRQAKLAARAAERAALEQQARPFAGLAMETELVALQEFVPSAVAELNVKGLKEPVHLCTVLPGAIAALVREDGDGAGRYVALQVQHHSTNPAKDLAYALNWVKDAAPGQTLNSGISNGEHPELSELVDAKAVLEPVEHQDFNWWLPENAAPGAAQNRGLQAANDSIIPSHKIKVDVEGVCWWVDAGDKGHIRWVRPEDEDTMLNALARVAAAGDLHVGEGTRFAGVFRTHGICVPVFDVDPTVDHSEYADALTKLDKLFAEAAKQTEALTAEERRQLDNIKSRQVTIR